MIRRPWHVTMRGRDPDEEHRAATPLELLFDLCFVVGVAQAGIGLHHELADGHLAFGLLAYLAVFFAIWWAWMNFTWFASAYDTDDVLYRLLTFVQIGGVLVIAAGTQRVFDDLDMAMLTVGYAIMRIGLVFQWLRAAHEDHAHRATALRYAAGITVVQVVWLLRLALPADVAMPLFVILVGAELAVPLWAEGADAITPFHRGHVAERYGLFTIIVLGEVVLAAATAIQEAITATGVSAELVVLALGGLILIAGLWWAYFKHDSAEDRRLGADRPFAWGYGHYVVFAAIAAVGAGLQVAADRLHEDVAIGPVVAGLGVAVPVGVCLVAIAVVHGGGEHRLAPIAVGVMGVLAAGASAAVIGVTGAVLLVALTVAAIVAVTAYAPLPGVA